MVKDQHPQAAKEASGNMLPAWLDACKVLSGFNPQQDILGEHWDGLEIRIQIFRVRTAFSFLFSRRYIDLAGKGRPSIRYIAPYLPAYVASALHHLHALYPTYVR
jgi:hypothetical protein